MTTASSTTPEIISDEDFKNLIAKRAMELLYTAQYLSKNKSTKKILTRPLLGKFLTQAAQIEELLDAYGAKNNNDWYTFRSLTAAIKLFSNVSYELLHIRHVLPAYQLLPIEHDFNRATKKIMDFTAGILLKASDRILRQASKLNLEIPVNRRTQCYDEQLPQGQLPPNRAARELETVSETVKLLATAFLNLAEESDLVNAATCATKGDITNIQDIITEERLRLLKLRFHTLQSLYDTYVSQTDIENVDMDLPVLRGHISIVFHLLKIATELVHYYERHTNRNSCNNPDNHLPLVNPKELLEQLMDYCVNFSSEYLISGQRLCRNMLKRYAEIGCIEVNIPEYRGFHVRPSTLVSKIVHHYGSNVQIKLRQETYDASSTLEIFRINEKINAEKRRWLANEIAKLPIVNYQQNNNAGTKEIIQNIILTLAQQNKLIIYEQPLKLLDSANGVKDGILLQNITDEIARLQAVGKIDIRIDLSITFEGDKRVLDDIKLLAESGYGEDNFGNNIPLPKKLSYLRTSG